MIVSFPGRAGDILWALPTVRAISQHLGAPVSLQIAGEFASLVPLLATQPYLEGVVADPRWTLTPPEEWRAPALDPLGTPPLGLVHLGYRGWPPLPLAQQTYQTARETTGWDLPPLDLATPWITVPPSAHRTTLAIGFTEEWFELKLGLVHCVKRDYQACDCRNWTAVMIPDGRWAHEGGIPGVDWAWAAARIAGAQVFLGCCAALHVLAVALGVPVVLVEPSAARWNPIFYPVGMDGPQVTIVRGGDGQPTFDARIVGVALRETIRRRANR